METSLIFLGRSMPPLSLRRVCEKMSFVPLGSFRRTVGGTLSFQEAPLKFHLLITGVDVEGPSFASLVRGTEVTVHPLHRLWEKEGGSLMRPMVPDSLQRYRERGLISYRPILEMRVLEMESTVEEWANTTTWALTLEEI